jgi:hypothetical protein
MVQWIISTSHVSDLSNQNLSILCRDGIVVENTSRHHHTNRNHFYFVSHSIEGNVKVTRHVNRDYGERLQIPIFKCQWVKHPNGVSVNNYGLTLVDLKNVGHKDDIWVLADRVAQVFYVLDPETGKHIVVSGK